MIWKYFKDSIITLVLGLAIAFAVSWWQAHSPQAAIQACLTALILAVLEVSLSFDNAVVNATIIKKMTPVWQKRFITWGILIAVFGMRLVFPLAIVAIMASINPFEAFMLSFSNPQKYAEIMASAHTSVAAFGGMFLFMVFIHFFVNEEKDEHWFPLFEKPLTKMAGFQGLELGCALAFLVILSRFLPPEENMTFLSSGAWGVITYLVVHSIANYLEKMGVAENSNSAVATGGFGLFLYLEVLDASFSFDGVIGAFAITNSLVQIMIGLGIGAFFVRSLTIYFVERDTLSAFIYLEHGAFYALGALAVLMISEPFLHIPEWVTGLTGAMILITSVLWSIYEDRKRRAR